jgi:hypothetical protein
MTGLGFLTAWWYYLPWWLGFPSPSHLHPAPSVRIPRDPDRSCKTCNDMSLNHTLISLFMFVKKKNHTPTQIQRDGGIVSTPQWKMIVYNKHKF